MARGDAEYVQFEKRRYRNYVLGLRRFIKSPGLAERIGEKVESIIKVRTWLGEDVATGKPFEALQADYESWKGKRRPGRPILFFDKEMVKSLRGAMFIVDVGDRVKPMYVPRIPDSAGLAKAKQRRHEELGVKRTTPPYIVRRQFSSLNRKEIRTLDKLFYRELIGWIGRNVKRTPPKPKAGR